MLANFKKDINDLQSESDQCFYALKDSGLSSGKSKMKKIKVIDPVETAFRGNLGVQLLYERLCFS
jgi:hypothetical protein